jgi:flagellar biosynthesis protein FliR
MALQDSKTRCVLKKSTDIISMIVVPFLGQAKAPTQCSIILGVTIARKVLPFLPHELNAKPL